MNNEISTTIRKSHLTPRQYIHVLHFIRDLYDYKKNQSREFNLDLWSAELGFKSRSFMYMVFQGKRLVSPKLVEILTESMKFSTAEKEHLLLLSYYQSAKSNPQKTMYLNKILESLESENKNTN